MLMLTCGVGWLATGLATRFDRTDFLPDSIQKPDSVESEILKRIGGSSRVVVYLKSADSIAVDDVSPLLNRLADGLRVLPGVEAVAARVPDATMDFVESELPARFPLYLSPNALRLIGQRLSYEGMKEALLSGNDSSQTFRLPEDPLGVTGIVATTLGQIAGASPIQIDNGYFTVRDRSHFFVVVDLFAGSADVNQTTTIVSTIQSTVSDVYNEMNWEVCVRLWL